MTYNSHIFHLKTTCHKSLDLISNIASKRWGSDKRTLQTLYTTLTLSKLDYACQIYSQTHPRHLIQLNPIQNRALRIISGAFRSSPTVSLEVETQTLPLTLRRFKLTCQLYSKLLSNPHHTPLPLNTDTPPPYWPLAQTIHDIALSSGLPFTTIFPFPHPTETPTWLGHNQNSCSPFTTQTKYSNLPYHTKSNYLLHQSRHPQHIPIYTDGSKSNTGTGAAAIFPTITLSTSLPNHISNYTAELAAILLAVHQISLSNDPNTYIIHTDSKSTIQALQNTKTKHPLIPHIHYYLYTNHLQHKHISFCWVPAHVGISGNEQADKEAKRISTLPPPDASPITPQIPIHNTIPATDLYPYIKNHIHQQWQAAWNDAPTHPHLHHIYPIIQGPRPSIHNRLLDATLTRLRIGHTNITHSHLMNRSLPTNCTFCDSPPPITVAHLIISCPRLIPIQLPPSQTPPTLQSLLANPDQHTLKLIFSYLIRNKLLHSI